VTSTAEVRFTEVECLHVCFDLIQLDFHFRSLVSVPFLMDGGCSPQGRSNSLRVWDVETGRECDDPFMRDLFLDGAVFT
jgi:hypothetical protein